MGGIDGRIQEIERRVAWLRREDKVRGVFGASQHGYEIAPAVPEEELAAFEAEHELTLPPTYRAYINTVGNGGAGPYYGLAALTPLEIDERPQDYDADADADADAEGNDIATGEGKPIVEVRSRVDRPFPLSSDWSQQDGPLPIGADVSPYDGCLHLADQGCGYFDFLVTKGPATGQVWSDYTAADGGITKAYDDFLEWYEHWLDGAQLEWLEKNAAAMALYAPRHYPNLEDCIRLLEEALERSPAWAPGWRASGYIALNQERFDDARAAFDEAAKHGTQEPKARHHLDLARLAGFQGEWTELRKQAELGLAQKGVWHSTQGELQRERLCACDRLEDAEGAFTALSEMVADQSFSLDDHFELAFRRLQRDEHDQAWEVLDDAITRNVSPDRRNNPATREGVYGQFADWIAEETPELASLVRAHI